MRLQERLLHLVGWGGSRPLINPDFVREGIEEQNLKDSFVGKVERFSPVVISLPEATGKNMSIDNIIVLRHIDWKEVNARFLAIVASDRFGFRPSRNNTANIRFKFGPETKSAWLSLDFKEDQKPFPPPHIEFHFSVGYGRCFDPAIYGEGYKGLLTKDNLALLEGKNPNIKTALEIANLAADFVNQALNRELDATILIEPDKPYESDFY